jgi:hypothetical protein
LLPGLQIAFSRLDPACPHDRVWTAVRCISDRCLPCRFRFWTSLPRRDLSRRIISHHRFARRHLLASRTIATLSFLPFFAHSPRAPFPILSRCSTLSPPPPPHHTPYYCRQDRTPATNDRSDAHRNTSTVNATQPGSHGSLTPVDPHIPGSTYLDILDIQSRQSQCRILNSRGVQCRPPKTVSLRSSTPGDHRPIDPSPSATRLPSTLPARPSRISSLLLQVPLLRAMPPCRQRPTAIATTIATPVTATARARLQACVHSTAEAVLERVATQTPGSTNLTTK